MSSKTIIPEIVNKDLNKSHSLKINLKKIENNQTYNKYYHNENNSTIINNKKDPSFLVSIFSFFKYILLSPIRFFNYFSNHTNMKDYKNYLKKSKKKKLFTKNLNRMNSSYKLDDETF